MSRKDMVVLYWQLEEEQLTLKGRIAKASARDAEVLKDLRILILGQRHLLRSRIWGIKGV